MTPATRIMTCSQIPILLNLTERICQRPPLAKKRLKVIQTDKLTEGIAAASGELVTKKPGSRIVIFVKTPKLVDDVRKVLISRDKSRQQKVAVLTGTMRGSNGTNW